VVDRDQPFGTSGLNKCLEDDGKDFGFPISKLVDSGSSHQTMGSFVCLASHASELQSHVLPAFFGPSGLQFTHQWTKIHIFHEIIDLLEFQRKTESHELFILNPRRSRMVLDRIASVFRDQILVMVRLWDNCVQSEQQGPSHTF
jgi:hypothetical protein